MRIGEALNLTTDCLQHVQQGRWLLHVPLGKLHNERWLPIDDDIRQIVARILALRNLAPKSDSSAQPDLPLPQPKGHRTLGAAMRRRLAITAKLAGCSSHITPHQLRHTYATELMRAGASLPVLKELLGHRSIRMTLRYVKVSQSDIQEQYHEARKNIAERYVVPKLPMPEAKAMGLLDIAAIRESIAGASHLLEMYRRHLHDDALGVQLKRLATRLASVSKKLRELDNAPK
jgi:integrase